MKNTLIYLGFLLLLCSCNSKEANSKKNIELIADYVKAVEKMDFDVMDSYLSENYLGIGPSFGDSINKKGAVTSWKKNVTELYEKIEYKKSRNAYVIIDSGENQGDWVSNWAELQITFQDDQKVVTIWANSMYLIENDKIVKSYTFYNEADALEQLGYVFINPDNL
jgi:hypothetical protein